MACSTSSRPSKHYNQVFRLRSDFFFLFVFNLFFTIPKPCTAFQPPQSTPTFHSFQPPKSSPPFTSIFVFGDSTVDTGNNKYIHTMIKSNHHPYGHDFPNQTPTGRFSNGKVVPDFLASSLGIKELVPPYLDPNLCTEELLTGVNFASGGAGFDDLTYILAGRASFSEQIRYFKQYKQKVQSIVGDEHAEKIINGGLTLISAGSNDFLITFYDLKVRKIQYNDIGDYQDFLLHRLEGFIKELYYLGLRNFVISGLPPLGCVPLQLTIENSENRTCLSAENADCQAYNLKLQNSLAKMEASLPLSKVIYADIYHPYLDMIINQEKYGFTETTIGCCGTGFIEMGPLCNSFSPLCSNSANYLFWDAAHPSERANEILSNSIMDEISHSM